jgi:hypothetical protein
MAPFPDFRSWTPTENIGAGILSMHREACNYVLTITKNFGLHISHKRSEYANTNCSFLGCSCKTPLANIKTGVNVTIQIFFLQKFVDLTQNTGFWQN